MSYFNSITQNVLVSETNNSSTNLISGGTFTGIGESTLGVAGIQVNLRTDQNCVIYVEQGPNADTWDVVDSYNYFYSLGGEGITVQATNAFFRVKVTNQNTNVGTSYFRLSVALCPIVDALPRSLSSDGNLKVAVNEINGYLGSKVDITPMGDMRVQIPYRLVGSTFIGSILDTNFWSPTYTGSGTATTYGGVATISTGTSANSTTRLSSVRYGRYVAGNSNYFRGQIKCPAISGTCIRRWGAFDTSDGYFFEYNGTTLSVVNRKLGSDNKVDSGSFNGTEGSTYTIGNIATTYEIYWTNKSVWFVINDELIHKTTSATTTLTGTPTLPLCFECNNSGGNVNNNSLEIRVASINRLGTITTEPIYKNISTNSTTILKYGAGKLHRIVVNTKGGNGNSAVVYDNTSAVAGSTIGTLDTYNTALATVEYGCPFFTGLTIVMSGSTAANLTVIYE
jgi:hypothetical protein